MKNKFYLIILYFPILLVNFFIIGLSVPVKEIIEEFNKEYPYVNILPEASGSVECVRKITELKRSCDIIISSDYKVIDNLLIPDYSDWSIKFASNEMAIVYNDKSLYKNEINKNNWYEILSKKDVIFGRADPNSDPCGYRSVITTKLAEKCYKKPGLAALLLNKDINFIRPKEVDLLALLETHTVDYIFLYRSVAEQHKLNYIILPDEINLKKQEMADIYATASIEITGKKPGEKIIQKGEPMIYGLTILKNAPNYKTAEIFTQFFLSKNKGMAVMEKNGQPSLVPCKTFFFDKIPVELQKFVIK
ncbi:MAG: substrate-binding domain-containing protein [Bacteroidia bacterium]|nr:substrate-binding domain-containing protein [Bacteroidia bacterium]